MVKIGDHSAGGNFRVVGIIAAVGNTADTHTAVIIGYKVAIKPVPVELKEWLGSISHDLEHDGYEAIVLIPEQK